MAVLAALGPAEYLLVVGMWVLAVGYPVYCLIRAIRKLNDCHAMLSELVREKRERDQLATPPVR